MNFDQLYPGRFLKAGHFEKPRTLRIKDVDHEELHGDKGPSVKVVISFDDEKLSLVACKTNGLCIREMFGPAIDDWIGKRVALFAGEWAGEPCVRVWGSPDIERDIDALIALPRKKPFVMKLRALGKPAPVERQKPKHRQEVSKYLHLMKDAAVTTDLDKVLDQVAEDNGLTTEETALLLDAAKRRSGQLTHLVTEQVPA